MFLFFIHINKETNNGFIPEQKTQWMQSLNLITSMPTKLLEVSLIKLH